MENRKASSIVLVILNLIGFLGMVAVNGLANALPLNNQTTGALSDKYPNLFVPAGLTFSIWGVIYILLGIFVVYGLVCALSIGMNRGFIDRIGILFFVSCLANIGWIFTWHYEMLGLSLLLMTILLACLIAIYLLLSVGKSGVAKKERYMVHLPFSVYLGWITIAPIANVAALLVDMRWNTWGLGETFWTVLMIVVGIALALIMLFQRRDIFYCIVVDWAILGILLKRLATEANQAVVITTIVGLALITLGIILQLARRKVY
jgi:hypothetical protein